MSEGSRLESDVDLILEALENIIVSKLALAEIPGLFPPREFRLLISLGTGLRSYNLRTEPDHDSKDPTSKIYVSLRG